MASHPSSSTSLDITQEKKNLKLSILQKEKQYIQVLGVVERLKSELSDFQRLYDTKIRRLYGRLNYLEGLLFKYHHISEYVDDILSFEEAEKIFEDTMKDRRARIDDEFKNEYKSKFVVDKKITMVAQELEEIKLLYRKLAHMFHPDKTGGDEHMMKEINKAYMEGDLEALRNLDLEHIPREQDETLSGLEHKLTDIVRRIEHANKEIRTLRKSDMYVLRKNLLKKNKTNHVKILDNLSHELRKKILQKEEEVAQFVEKYGPTEELHSP